MAELVLSQSIIDILVIIVSFFILNWASNLSIKNAVKVSTITRLSKTSIGFSLIAFSTSLPELTVALIAAFSGGSSLSVGNVIGSNIVNICIVLGLATVILYLKRGRKCKGVPGFDAANIIPQFAKSDLSSIHFGLFISSLVPMILIYVSGATYAVGLILLFIFVGYMYKLSKIRLPEEENPVDEEEKKKLRRYLILTLVGIAGVVGSAYFLVESAVGLAESIGIPQTVIGATIIAVGTSLPELTLGIRSIFDGHSALAFGNIIGSSFVNITLILGITFFVPFLFGNAVQMNMDVFQNLIIFSIITNLFFWYFLSRERISWREGALFLFIYSLFLATTLGVIQPTG